MAKKLFYSMGEVSEMLDVNASLIRFWETKFDVLRPQKNKKGNRLFAPADVENLKLIYHLVKERGMTLEGAAKCMKQNKGTISRDAELLERLQRVRAMLEEVRAELKDGVVEEEAAVSGVAGADEKGEETAKPIRKERKKAVQEMAAEVSPVESAETQETDDKGPVQVIEPGPRSEKPAPKRTAARQPKRKKEKEEAENKELFAFYEQSLF